MSAATLSEEVATSASAGTYETDTCAFDPRTEFGAAPQQAVRILDRMNVGFPSLGSRVRLLGIATDCRPVSFAIDACAKVSHDIACSWNWRKSQCTEFLDYHVVEAQWLDHVQEYIVGTVHEAFWCFGVAGWARAV